MKKIIAYLLLLLSCNSLKAQYNNLDKAFKDSTEYIRLRYSFHQAFAPTGLMLVGSVLDMSDGIKNAQLRFHNNRLIHFQTKIDNYLQYVPAIIPYTFDALGIKSKTDIPNRTAILLKTEILQLSVVNIFKRSVKELRPDGSNYYSFPSGHSAQAFAAATILSEEYGYKFKWMPYVAYSFASGVGAMRIANNKHHIGDVLVGAGIGILSTKIIYWTHKYKWGKRTH